MLQAANTDLKLTIVGVKIDYFLFFEPVKVSYRLIGRFLFFAPSALMS